MTWTQFLRARGARAFDRRVMVWLICLYPLLYAVGYLSKSVAGSAAIWPAHALTFAAYVLLPMRLWPLVATCTICLEMVAIAALYWGTSQSHPSVAMTVGFATANILTSIGPAGLARAMRLLRRQDRFQLVIS